MKQLILALLLIGTAYCPQAQTNKVAAEDLALMESLEDTLGLVSFLIVNDSTPENRFAATKKMIPTLVKALKIKHSFSYPFEQLRAVSIQYPADSTFRVFTWQLYVDAEDYRYYGAIQMNTPELQLIPLIDRTKEVQSEEQDILTHDKWFGALYYNIHQFDSPTGRQYLMFGFNGDSFFHKKKFIDVLSFKNGKASFGAPVFIEEDTISGRRTVRNRIVKEYSAETSIRMNYDETFELIIYDHLITVAGSYGQGPTSVPDGSYEGYQLANDGLWYYVEKVFDQVSEEAPRPEPVLNGGSKKDIFGKKKN
ncbi:MAG: hypothetical protein AAFZ15_19550 [Bacteroidota bacterium]